MDIREVRTERVKLEKRIYDCIMEFESKTGLGVQEVIIEKEVLRDENGNIFYTVRGVQTEIIL